MPQIHAVDDGRYVFDLSLPIERVTAVDLNNGEWHQWLTERLGEMWPEIGSNNFRGHVAQWVRSKDHLFLRCGEAVCLAMCWGQPLGKPIVKQVFMFVRDKSKLTWRNEMRRLFREMQIWAARLNAEGVQLDVDTCDYTRGRLMELVNASEENILWLEPQMK